MDSIEQMSEDAKAAAEEHSKPGSFSLIDRLLSREYPTEVVDVYLNERAGHRIARIEAELARTANDSPNLPVLEAQLAHETAEARASLVRFHLEGISVEDYDSIVEAAQAEFPLEYRESRNPMTMAMERTVIENEARETYFRVHLWARFIRWIEDADGNRDENVTPESIARMQQLMPLNGLGRVHLAIESLRMTTNWMDTIQDEDFFPKS